MYFSDRQFRNACLLLENQFSCPNIHGTSSKIDCKVVRRMEVQFSKFDCALDSVFSKSVTFCDVYFCDSTILYTYIAEIHQVICC